MRFVWIETKSACASSSSSSTPARAGLSLDLGGQRERVRVDHVHAEPLGAAGDRLSDPSEAHDADRLVVHVLAQHHQGAPDPGTFARAGSRSPSPTRRAAAISSANAVSAVVSVSTSGVLVASTPAAVQAGTSMLSNPTAWLATIFSCGPGGGQELGVDLFGEHRDDGVAAGDHLEEFVARDAELVLVDRDVGTFLQERAVASSMIGRVTRMFGSFAHEEVLPVRGGRARSMPRTAPTG